MNYSPWLCPTLEINDTHPNKNPEKKLIMYFFFKKKSPLEPEVCHKISSGDLGLFSPESQAASQLPAVSAVLI